jgi:hypothetical protein
MKQIKEEGELIGKTIQRVGKDDNFFGLFFDNGDYAMFRQELWGDSVTLSRDDYNLEPTAYNMWDLRDMGVLSKEEYQRLSEQQRIKDARIEKKRELKQLQKLKEKYEK